MTSRTSLAILRTKGQMIPWQNAALKVAALIADSGFERMQTVTAYAEADQRGRRQMFAAGAYNAGENLQGWATDRISSLFVPQGFSVKVCQHDNGVGPCQTYTDGRTINLPASFDNSVSYVQVSRVGPHLCQISHLRPTYKVGRAYHERFAGARRPHACIMPSDRRNNVSWREMVASRYG